MNGNAMIILDTKFMLVSELTATSKVAHKEPCSCSIYKHREVK